MEDDDRASGTAATPASSMAPANRIRIYAKQRIPEIVADLQRLSGERAELIEKRMQTVAPDERRLMNQRWTYVALRMEALRSERAALVDQLKKLQAPAVDDAGATTHD